MKIAVDFDGTIVDHRFPEIGKPCPGAFDWLRQLHAAGAKLILSTMRSDRPERPYLAEAVQFCRERGVCFYGINRDPDQDGWTTSPKAYAECYIGDDALGCPLWDNPRLGGRPVVDWNRVGPLAMQRVRQAMAEKVNDGNQG